MTKDLQLTEFGTGGDLTITSNDLALTEELYQTVYLALFGGNIEAVTKGNEIATQQRFDYWANSLLFGQVPSKQFNSHTEAVISNVVLNSSGRLEIKRAVEKDIEFMNAIAETSVQVNIETTNRVEVAIRIKRLDNLQVKQLQFLFDNARNEVIIQKEI